MRTNISWFIFNSFISTRKQKKIQSNCTSDDNNAFKLVIVLFLFMLYVKVTLKNDNTKMLLCHLPLCAIPLQQNNSKRWHTLACHHHHPPLCTNLQFLKKMMTWECSRIVFLFVQLCCNKTTDNDDVLEHIIVIVLLFTLCIELQQ